MSVLRRSRGVVLVVVAGVLAAVAGTAIAGPDATTSASKAKQALKKSKKALKKSKKNKKAIKDIERTPGPAGPQGEQGPKGDPGQNIEVADLTITDGTTQTLFTVGEGTIGIECDASSFYRYTNDSGDTVHLSIDQLGGTWLSNTVLNGVTEAISIPTPFQHTEWFVTADDHIAEFDIIFDRTGGSDCDVTATYKEIER
ncbi:MAG: collagen-like triple helix repeat-containing protein [Solirubrobacterales bacterium]